MEAMEKMSLLLELIIVLVYILMAEKNTLVLGEGPAQDLDQAAITAGAKYLVNFTESGKKFVLSLHFNGSNSF